MSMVEDLVRGGGLIWFQDAGVGYLDPGEDESSVKYDEAYLEEYERRLDDPMSAPLNKARCDLVERYYPEGPVVDVGPGAGAFISAMRERGRQAYGYDVNPFMGSKLVQEGLWRNPYDYPVDVITMWDVLEHIQDPRMMLEACRKFCFVSLPVFSGVISIMTSKHYKPGEHVWYWTPSGLIRFFESQGFECLEQNNKESMIGRQGIFSFAFRRVRD